jgi:hypothetical protein
MPFQEPKGPPPAKVVTDAVEISMRRIRLLYVSPTKAKEPVGEMLTPEGEENREFVPIPFVGPNCEPAKVTT